MIGFRQRPKVGCWCPGSTPPANGRSLDTSLFHFAGAPLQQFNDTVFRGNTGCSPHSPSDYMTISSMVRCVYERLLVFFPQAPKA